MTLDKIKVLRWIRNWQNKYLHSLMLSLKKVHIKLNLTSLKGNRKNCKNKNNTHKEERRKIKEPNLYELTSFILIYH